MKKTFIISLLVVLGFFQVKAQNEVMNWSIGDANITCTTDGANLCYSVYVSMDATSRQLGTTTFRVWLDPSMVGSPTVQNIQSNYTVPVAPVISTVAGIGTPLDFGGSTAYYMEFNLQENPASLLEIGGGTDVWVMDICAPLIDPDLQTVCSPFVFDNNSCSAGNGATNDIGWRGPGNEGMTGTYFLNNDQTLLVAGDDEVTHYLWTPDPTFDCVLNALDDTPGTVATTGCLVNTCVCTVEPSAAAPTPTQVGISTLQRNVNEWLPQDLSAYIALESDKKGFVITRNADPAGNIDTPEEGMIVWDTSLKCLRMYFDLNGDGTMTWNCINNACTP